MLTARQTSMLNGFEFGLFAGPKEGEKQVGRYAWPWVSQATNARLRVVKDPALASLSMEVDGRRFLCPFTFTRRGWSNDVSFELLDASTRESLATAEAQVVGRGLNVDVRWRPESDGSPVFPRSLRFSMPPIWLWPNVPVFSGNDAVARLHMPRRVVLRKTLCLSLEPGFEGWGRVGAAFLLLMGLNAIHR